MAYIPYKTYANISVENANAPLYQKAIKCLDKLASMPTGGEFLNDVNGTAHGLQIKPINGNAGSFCQASEENRALVLLALAMRTNNTALLKNEIVSSLGRASRSGVTVAHICKQLAAGLPPATYVGAQNVQRPATPAPLSPDIIALGGPAIMQALDQAAAACLVKLNDLAEGRYDPGSAEFNIGVRRILRNWLQPGRGTPCSVEINVERPSQCWSDRTNHMRYPTISMAHEMVHAWRFMTGKMLVWGGEMNQDLEEVIATGLPPYNYEKYSENIFRAQYPDAELEMRTSY
jgi:hypothetical protein